MAKRRQDAEGSDVTLRVRVLRREQRSDVQPRGRAADGPRRGHGRRARPRRRRDGPALVRKGGEVPHQEEHV